MMTNMMKKMSKGDPKGGIPPEIFNMSLIQKLTMLKIIKFKGIKNLKIMFG